MGIYDRDYERSYDTGSGWRDGGGGPGLSGGFAGWSANGKLLAVLAVLFAAQELSQGLVTQLLILPSDWYAQPWRLYGLVTYALIHGDFGHLVWNCVALYFFGRTVNASLGGREYLAYFFAAAVFGALAWTAVGLLSGAPPSLLLGASGGIAGVVILFCLMNPTAQVHIFFGSLPIPAAMLGLIMVGGDLYNAHRNVGNVAYTAHLGGALFAYLYFRGRWRVSDWLPHWVGGGVSTEDLGKKARSFFKSKPKLRVHHAEEDDAEDETDERLDEILRKIQVSGQDSLSRSEQRYLEQASRRFKNRRDS